MIILLPLSPFGTDDDYLISLVQAASAVLVSGDKHLLGLRGRIPVYAAAEFMAMLEAGS